MLLYWSCFFFQSVISDECFTLRFLDRDNDIEIVAAVKGVSLRYANATVSCGVFCRQTYLAVFSERLKCIKQILKNTCHAYRNERPTTVEKMISCVHL